MWSWHSKIFSTLCTYSKYSSGELVPWNSGIFILMLSTGLCCLRGLWASSWSYSKPRSSNSSPRSRSILLRGGKFTFQICIICIICIMESLSFWVERSKATRRPWSTIIPTLGFAGVSRVFEESSPLHFMMNKISTQKPLLWYQMMNPNCISFNKTIVKYPNQFRTTKIKKKGWIEVMINKRNSPQSLLGKCHLKGWNPLW